MEYVNNIFKELDTVKDTVKEALKLVECSQSSKEEVNQSVRNLNYLQRLYIMRRPYDNRKILIKQMNEEIEFLRNFLSTIETAA